MTAWQLLGLGAVILLGAGTQRVTGLGFALVAAPFVVLLIGPFDGVLLVNACGMITAMLVLPQVWRQVDLRRAGLLLGPALLAVVPGAWVARQVAAPVLAIIIGGMLLVALVAVLTSEKARLLQGAGGAVIAGAGSGFMSVTAGVGGPAITVYALSTRWPHQAFAATAQLIFAAMGAASVTAKGGMPALAPAVWAVVAAALGVGVLVGNRLAGRVSAHRAMKAVVLLALSGAAITIIKGVIQL
ncbi:MAG TPA: TSUP family transporter [Micromonospora sp.]|nr:TSUP family transporter [Micromonospora sp.]